MVGFGAMDNFVMIQAGQYIDSTLGVQLGLATMTAAAAGAFTGALRISVACLMRIVLTLCCIVLLCKIMNKQMNETAICLESAH